jgi:hypothetical protein
VFFHRFVWCSLIRNTLWGALARVSIETHRAAESSLGITWIINKSDDLISWIGNKIRCFVFVICRLL